jgi:hypothetical protein
VPKGNDFMPMIHIATPETFMAGAHAVDKVCPVCGHQAKIRYGYLDWHCSVCNLYVDPESFMGAIVSKIRHAMELDRKQFSLMLGVKHKTLSNAENYRCSNVIFDKARAIFHEFVKSGLESPHNATPRPTIE